MVPQLEDSWSHGLRRPREADLREAWRGGARYSRGGSPLSRTREQFMSIFLSRRHADAWQAAIALDCRQDELVLAIRDDGKGIDAEVMETGRVTKEGGAALPNGRGAPAGSPA